MVQFTSYVFNQFENLIFTIKCLHNLRVWVVMQCKRFWYRVGPSPTKRINNNTVHSIKLASDERGQVFKSCYRNILTFTLTLFESSDDSWTYLVTQYHIQFPVTQSDDSSSLFKNDNILKFKQGYYLFIYLTICIVPF